MSSRASHPIVGPSVAIRTPWGWRDKRTGRFTFAPRPTQLWRFSYGITFVQHGNYYGGIIQAWSVDRRLLVEARDELVDRLKGSVAGFLGFEDWEEWSFVKADGEGFQQVPYLAGLEGKWELWIENDQGRALVNEKGDLSDV